MGGTLEIIWFPLHATGRDTFPRPRFLCYKLFSHTIPTYPTNSREKLMEKRPQSHRHSAEKRHQQHLGSLKAFCHDRIPAQTPQTHFLLHLNRCNRQIFAYPSNFSNKSCWSEERSWFFSRELTFKKLQQFGTTPEELHKSRCKHRNCDAAQGEQLQIPTRGSDPLGHTRRAQHTPLFHNLFPKRVKLSLDPRWADGLNVGGQ